MSDDIRFEQGIRVSYHSFESGRFDDVKVIFFGSNEKKLAQIDGELKQMLNIL